MAKDFVTESRFDFRGGRVTSISPDILNPNELVDCTNARLDQSYGAIVKRTGSQRIHNAKLVKNPIVVPADNGIVGLTQWDGPNGKQVVALTQGRLYYRDGFNYNTAFSLVDNALLSGPAFFVTFRANTIGAPLVLYIAANGVLFSWDGAGTLTAVGGSAPTTTLLMVYHTRVFGTSLSYPKQIFWSKIGDATSWGTGTKADGGSALVDFLSGENMVGLEVIGSSLLMATNDCVMRFTGISTDDIVIQQDTEGVSSEVGIAGPYCIKRFENVAAIFNERGAYAATEVGVTPIGEQILPDWSLLSQGHLSTAVIEYDRGRKELIFAVPGANDGGLNKTLFVHSVRLQAWQGPWTYPFDIQVSCRYFDSSNRATWLSAGSDGYIRLMDVGQSDDISYSGAGGSNISMTIELPVAQFSLPGVVKATRRMFLQASLPSGSNLSVTTQFDGDASVTDAIPSNGTSQMDNYRVDLTEIQGDRLKIVFTESSGKTLQINGLIIYGSNMQRI